MYNDNEYHYNYSQNIGIPGQYYDARTGGEPFRNFDPAHTHVAQARPVQKKKGRAGIVALALTCALLGGVAGGGAVWAASRMTGSPVVRETTIQVAEAAGKSAAGTVGGGAAGAGDASAVAAIGGKKVLTEAQIYAASVDSVVSINVTGNTNVFGQVVQSASAGSGFLLTADGYIVTNYHVIEGSTTVKVTLYNNETYEAKIIGGDKDYDIAVIKIDPPEGKSFKPVTLGKSGELTVGSHVAAIGNPLGDLTFSMSEGIASSVNRAINVDGTPFNMIQVTCAINPGNSGGPLFNQYGEVVGVVSAKYSSYASTSVEGLGFAIPIDDVLSMIEDIMTNGYVANKPYLGISSGTLNAQMAAQYRYDITSGVFVFSVEENSAAQKAGLKMGDVITKVDDKEIKTLEDLNAAKKKYSAGDKATLTYYREGKSQTVEITWGSVPKEQLEQNQQAQQSQQTPRNGNNGNNQYGYGYSFPYGDLFDYFFGNGWGR